MPQLDQTPVVGPHASIVSPRATASIEAGPDSAAVPAEEYYRAKSALATQHEFDMNRAKLGRAVAVLWEQELGLAELRLAENLVPQLKRLDRRLQALLSTRDERPPVGLRRVLTRLSLAIIKELKWHEPRGGISLRYLRDCLLRRSERILSEQRRAVVHELRLRGAGFRALQESREEMLGLVRSLSKQSGTVPPALLDRFERCTARYCGTFGPYRDLVGHSKLEQIGSLDKVKYPRLNFLRRFIAWKSLERVLDQVLGRLELEETPKPDRAARPEVLPGSILSAIQSLEAGTGDSKEGIGASFNALLVLERELSALDESPEAIAYAGALDELRLRAEAALQQIKPRALKDALFYVRGESGTCAPEILQLAQRLGVEIEAARPASGAAENRESPGGRPTSEDIQDWRVSFGRLRSLFRLDSKRAHDLSRMVEAEEVERRFEALANVIGSAVVNLVRADPVILTLPRAEFHSYLDILADTLHAAEEANKQGEFAAISPSRSPNAFAPARIRGTAAFVSGVRRLRSLFDSTLKTIFPNAEWSSIVTGLNSYTAGIGRTDISKLNFARLEERLADVARPKGFPAKLENGALRRLVPLCGAESLDSIVTIPGNRVEVLVGMYSALGSVYSMRINNRWRITFVIARHGVDEIQLTDYHW